MAAVVLPVAVVFTNTIVGHLANAVLVVLGPVSLVLVSRLHVTVRSASITASIKEVTLENVSILVGGSSKTSETTGAALELIVLCSELILSSVSVLRHPIFPC